MSRLRLVLVALGGLVLLLALSPTASADGPIRVTAAAHQNQYPAEIRFTLEAESASTINKITLRHRIIGQPASSANSVEFAAGTRVKAQYVWNTQRRYIPPGVDLEYFWQIEDIAGNRTQTAPVTFTADDTRFNWQALAAGKLSVGWYKGDKAFGQALLDAGTLALAKLADEVGVTLDRRGKVFVYETQEDMMGALRPNGVEWAGGSAFPAAGIIVLSADPSSSGRDYGLRTVRHELSHLVVHIATDNPFGGVPSWLDEGLATYAEGTLPAAYKQSLDRGIASNRLLSLQSLSGNFPTDAEQSLLGYAESNSVVRHLLTKYGRAKMTALLNVFRAGSTVDAALREVYGFNLTGLEDEWRAGIGAKPLNWPDLAATAVPATATPSAQRATPPPLPSGDERPTAVPVTPPSAGRSCFGGLLTIGSAIGGLLLVATRLRLG